MFVFLLLGVTFSSAAQTLDQLVKRGLQRMAVKNYKGAIEDFTLALEETPDDINLSLNRAIAKRELRNYEGAIEDIGFALEVNRERDKCC